MLLINLIAFVSLFISQKTKKIVKKLARTNIRYIIYKTQLVIWLLSLSRALSVSLSRFFCFILRFWNQILTCVSFKDRAAAISRRRCRVRYLLKWNSFSSSVSCLVVNVVLPFCEVLAHKKKRNFRLLCHDGNWLVKLKKLKILNHPNPIVNWSLFLAQVHPYFHW